LAGSGKGLAKQFLRAIEIVTGQLHLTAQRLRPRQQRQPVIALSDLDGGVEVLGG
jgi:hypothetical protein